MNVIFWQFLICGKYVLKVGLHIKKEDDPMRLSYLLKKIIKDLKNKKIIDTIEKGPSHRARLAKFSIELRQEFLGWTQRILKVNTRHKLFNGRWRWRGRETTTMAYAIKFWIIFHIPQFKVSKFFKQVYNPTLIYLR